MRTLLLFALAASGLAMSGCGGKDLPPMGYVTGKVTLDGEPVPGAVVMFIVSTTDAETGMPATLQSSGVANENGEYEAMYLTDRGAPVGEAKIQLDQAGWDVASTDENPDPPPSPWLKKIPAKYFAPFDSLTIKEGESQVKDLPMVSK